MSGRLDLAELGLEGRPVRLAAVLRVASLGWQDAQPSEENFEGRALEAPQVGGRFEGLPPQVELLDDGRKIRLLTPLTFIHPDWDSWPVPVGIIADGASIPRPFWAVIGGPFEGRYRNASIVHDHYCVVRNRPWRDVHRMFYEAMLAGGVSTAKAKIMYYAVYRFGPRWKVGEEAPEQTEMAARPLSDRQVEEFALDAEAIYLHLLNLDEIEALADARSSVDETLEGLEGPDVTDRTRALVIAGGSATAEDVRAVAAQAAYLPSFLLDRFERTGIRIVACRESVTDFERSLRGVVPRGWERTGKTWDNVPGAYLPARKRVIIATMNSAEGRTVPTKASRRHGSVELVVHESFHAFDYIGGHAVLRHPGYLAARIADLDRLGTYERQDGQAGLEESFAESGARFAFEPDAMEADWPNLFAYWSGGFGEIPIVEGVEFPSEQAPDAPIGTAQILPNGEIEMDLRAEGPGGAIGHAWLTIPPDSPAHSAQLAWLNEGRAAEEALAGELFLVKP